MPSLSTEEVATNPTPEERLASAVLLRAIEDIAAYDEVLHGRKKLSRSGRETQKREACEAIAFFFLKKNRIREFWMQISGLKLVAVRETLILRFPWILTI